MSDAPAGWYPDPSAPQSLRYWDGAAWTEHVAPAQGAPTAYVAQAGPTTPDGVPLAGWGMRVLAYIIDTVLIGGTGFLVTLPQQIEAQRRMQELTDSVARDSQSVDMSAFWHDYFAVMRDQMTSQIPVLLLGVAYFVIMLRWKGATVGKLVVGLRVRLRDEPGRLPWGAIAIRVAILNLLGVAPIAFLAAGWWQIALVVWPIAAIFSFVNLLRPLWNSKRQAFHDQAARTNVVKVR